MTHEERRELDDRVAERIWAVMRPLRNDPRPWASIGHEQRQPFIDAAKDAIRMIKHENEMQRIADNVSRGTSDLVQQETERRERDGGS